MGSFNLGRSEEAVQDEQLASLDLPKLKQANKVFVSTLPDSRFRRTDRTAPQNQAPDRRPAKRRRNDMY